MPVDDPQFARSEVLRIFNHAQVYLFLGAAITTVGLLAAFFSLLRRRFDALLLWFALFAVFYGIRLAMNYQLLRLLGEHSLAFERLSMVISFLIPIPAFFFFRQLNLLGGVGRLLLWVVCPIVFVNALATLIVGPREIFFQINNIFIITSLVTVAVVILRIGPGSPDITIVRRGLFVFIAGALFDNVVGLFHHFYNIEPFTFLALLASLGIVAGRRNLAREQELTLIQKELDIAQQIQLSILPASFPPSRNFSVAARYLPMTSVAGDFYDFFTISEHEAGLLIADVSGHGIPAALIASMVKLAATTQRANAGNPDQILLGMNGMLYGHTQNQFITAGYVYLNAGTQELRYAAAAHPPMLLLRNGEIIEIVENGLMLAAFSFADYSTATRPIQSGDRLVLYTDGLLEAANLQQEEFGPDRFHGLLRETAALSNTDAADRIIASIQTWSAAQNDDLTILMCDYTA